MPTPTAIAISAESLLSLPIEALIDLYNAESKRLAGNLDAHLVDETYKPLHIVKLMAKLPIRYQMMADQASNEQAALSRSVQEKAVECMDDPMVAVPLTHNNKGFHLMR